MFDFASDAVLSVLVAGRGGKLLCSLLEKLQPTVEMSKDGERFVFATPNQLALWRARTLFDKEPETLEWIDSFEEGDVFYDVGANVGTYTVYAGVRKRGLKIFAFEPTFFNYRLLNQNLLLNGLGDRVCALCVALASRDSLDRLNIPSVVEGSGLVTFGKGGDCAFRQGAMAYALDSFIEKFNPPFPNHIKVDVDGLEPEIVAGALRTMGDPRLKSVSLELDDSKPVGPELVRTLEGCGLKLRQKRHSEMIERSEFRDVFNGVFVRI